MFHEKFLFCIRYDFILMFAKKIEIQNDLPIMTRVMLTSYLFNKIVANNISRAKNIMDDFLNCKKLPGSMAQNKRHGHLNL